MPFEQYVYLVSDMYEDVDVGQGKLTLLSEEGRVFKKWLERFIQGKYVLESIGMIRIDPSVESLFVLRWI